MPINCLQELLPGPSYSKLRMSLHAVNDSLKFQMAILQIHVHCYFLLICNKNNSVFAFEVDI